MYIHLGMGVVVREEDVIGIFDMENTTVSDKMRDFLRRGIRWTDGAPDCGGFYNRGGRGTGPYAAAAAAAG